MSCMRVAKGTQLRYEENRYHDIVMGHGLGNVVFIRFNPDGNGDMQSNLARLGKETTARCGLKASASRKARTRGHW
jgi:hypothetical protein